MASRSLNSLIALAVIAWWSTSFASMDDLRTRIKNNETQLEAKKSEIESARAELSEKTLDLDKLKKENKNLVSKIFLQKKMREAQSLSVHLEDLSREADILTQTLENDRLALLREIDREISKIADSKIQKKSQISYLNQLLHEKDDLLLTQHRKLMQVPQLELSSPSALGKEDLVEKLRVVKDLQSSMKQKIAMLQDEIDQEQSREFLQKEVAQFLNEESFFGEQSFIISGADRRENDRNQSNTGLRRETAKTATAPDDPSSQPQADRGIPSIVPETGIDPTPSAGPEIAPQISPQVSPEINSDGLIETNLGEIAPALSENLGNLARSQDSVKMQTLLHQVRNSINDKSGRRSHVQSDTRFDGSSRQFLQQNLLLSEKILSDLQSLRTQLETQIKNFAE